MTANVNTYNGLATAIQQWTNRNDSVFIENIPLFISLAEQQVFIDCSILGNQFYITSNFTANNETFSKPANWGKTLSFSYIDSSGNIVVLKRANYEFLRTFAPANNITTTVTQPQYYSDFGYNYFLITPTPTEAYAIQICYSGRLQPLSIQNQTNWMTQNAYDMLFWSCLEKAYRFVDNATDAEIYNQKYTARLQALLSYNMEIKNDRSSNTMKD